MEDTVCTGCGRQMTLKDLDRQTFREIDGKLYCPECILRMGHPRRIRCPNCGRQTTAALIKGAYVCSHCGKEIGGLKKQGVIKQALPSSKQDREDAETREPPLPPADIPQVRPADSLIHARRRDRTVHILGLLLSLFVVGTLVLGAILIKIHANKSSRPDASIAKQEQALKTTEDWVAAHPDELDRAIELYKGTLEDLTSTELRAEALVRLAQLQSDQAAAAAQSNEKRIEQLEQQIARLKAAAPTTPARAAKLPKPAPTPAPKPEETPPSEPPIAAPVATVPAAVVDPKAAEADAAYNKALTSARTLLSERKYGPAMQALEVIPKNYPGTAAAKSAAEQREQMQATAYDDFRKISERADTLVRNGDTAGAKELYRDALIFEFPPITQLVNDKLARLGVAEAAPGLPAIVQDLLVKLQAPGEIERSEAARSLGNFGNPGVIAALTKSLGDPHWLVRSRTAESLGKLKAAAAVPALIGLLEDPNSTVAFDANEALRRITGETFAANEKDKWQAWLDKQSGSTVPIPAASPADSSFVVKVLERKYSPNSVGFMLPPGIEVSSGAKFDVLNGADVVGQLVLQSRNLDRVLCEIQNLKPGFQIAPGDTLTLRLIK